MSESGGANPGSLNLENPHDTLKQAAEDVGVSHQTIQKGMDVKRFAYPEKYVHDDLQNPEKYDLDWARNNRKVADVAQHIEYSDSQTETNLINPLPQIYPNPCPLRWFYIWLALAHTERIVFSFISILNYNTHRSIAGIGMEPFATLRSGMEQHTYQVQDTTEVMQALADHEIEGVDLTEGEDCIKVTTYGEPVEVLE